MIEKSDVGHARNKTSQGCASGKNNLNQWWNGVILPDTQRSYSYHPERDDFLNNSTYQSAFVLLHHRNLPRTAILYHLKNGMSYFLSFLVKFEVVGYPGYFLFLLMLQLLFIYTSDYHT